MKFIQHALFVFLILISWNGYAQKKIRLQSPDHNISFLFTLTNGAASYQVDFKDKRVVDKSTLGLAFENNENFTDGLVAGKPVFKTGNETYDLVVGKTKTVNSHYEELTIPLMRKTGAEKKQVNIVVRAFNDGLAFRYEFPSQTNWANYTLTEEQTTFKLAQNPTVLTLFRENYTTSHEGYYDSLKLSDVKDDTLMDLPTLFQYPGGIYMAITEANLRDYAGMYLAKKKGVLTTMLSPLPGQTAIKVRAILPHHTPWRVMMISDRVGALIESNILTNLCEPNEVKDVSWIKPGKCTFPWWNGSIVPDTTWPGGNNFETNKYYIDFCARHKIEYHSVVEYGMHEWYINDGAGFSPGPNVDATKSVAGLDMKAICDYAKQQGVGVRVWVHWKALYPKLEAAFTQYEKWGLSGLMMDFMDRDDQEMVNIYEEVLRSAAKHKLHIQFHGAFKPSGLHRTFPNEFTREATYNYEVNKWNEQGLSPDHDINMPFTRMLAGATDYHLGGFRAVPPAKFKTQQSRPLVIGTRCHMLAMYVVLESYLGMVCDYPAAYEGQPGFKFIEDVPTSWDETVVPGASVHEYVTIARRKGQDWFIGTINSTKARSVQLSLKFLPPGKYTAEIYSDANDTAENPNHLSVVVQTVSNADTIVLQLAAGGGQAIRLVKQ
ncbi:MAG: glycoside hydrolase family 97 protein [Ferruginibacter sp.]